MKVVPAVSLVTLAASQPLLALMADSASTTLQVTETLLVYQPLLPSVPLTVGVITGGVVSGAGTTS